MLVAAAVSDADVVDVPLDDGAAVPVLPVLGLLGVLGAASGSSPEHPVSSRPSASASEVPRRPMAADSSFQSRDLARPGSSPVHNGFPLPPSPKPLAQLRPSGAPRSGTWDPHRLLLR